LGPWKLGATASDTGVLGSKEASELRYEISRSPYLLPWSSKRSSACLFRTKSFVANYSAL